MNISFAGCGFMGIYHVGVSACLQAHAPFMLEGKIAGASAGSLAAVAIIGDVSLLEMVKECVRVAGLASENILGPFHPKFNINIALKDALDRILPEDIHVLASARLYISLTKAVDGSNWIVSDFDSKEDLINAILGSSFIPVFSGFFPPKYRGTAVVDGGYSDNVPTFLGNTVTVSPFHGNQDICPEDDAEIAHLLGLKLPTGLETNITLSAENIKRLGKSMIPPKIEDMMVLCRQGYQDAFRFLRSRNIIQCEDCQTKRRRAGLASLDEWRRDESCSTCSKLSLSVNSLDLPQDMLDVFNKELEIKNNNSLKKSSSSSSMKDVKKNEETESNLPVEADCKTRDDNQINVDASVKKTK